MLRTLIRLACLCLVSFSLVLHQGAVVHAAAAGCSPSHGSMAAEAVMTVASDAALHHHDHGGSPAQTDHGNGKDGMGKAGMGKAGMGCVSGCVIAHEPRRPDTARRSALPSVRLAPPSWIAPDDASPAVLLRPPRV